MDYNEIPEDDKVEPRLTVSWVDSEGLDLGTTPGEHCGQRSASSPCLPEDIAAAKVAARVVRTSFFPALVGAQTQSLYRGEVVVYAGGPETAKSSLVLALTKLLAGQGTSCFTYSLEHPRLAVFNRLVESEMATKFDLLRITEGVPAAAKQKQGAILRLRNLPFVIKYDPIEGVDGLYAQVLKTQVYCLGMPADVVLVDNLRLLVDDDSRQARELMLGLKAIARELDIVIVTTFPLPALPVHQDRPPQMADFKKWEPVAMLADRVFGLHRNEVEPEPELFEWSANPRSSKMVIDIHPLRNGVGSRDILDLLFDGYQMTFSHETQHVKRKSVVAAV